MLGWLSARSKRRRSAEQLYEGIVAAARTPALYETCGVPDTMDGRLEMLLLHTVLVLDRLRTEGAEGQRLGQRLMERLIADTDDALRQIGLGDDSVAIRIKRLGGALQERVRDYRDALSSTSEAMQAALLMHVHAEARPGAEEAATSRRLAGVARLAGYARRSKKALANQPAEQLLDGCATFAPVILPATTDTEVRP